MWEGEHLAAKKKQPQSVQYKGKIFSDLAKWKVVEYKTLGIVGSQCLKKISPSVYACEKMEVYGNKLSNKIIKKWQQWCDGISGDFYPLFCFLFISIYY